MSLITHPSKYVVVASIKINGKKVPREPLIRFILFLRGPEVCSCKVQSEGSNLNSLERCATQQMCTSGLVLQGLIRDSLANSLPFIRSTISINIGLVSAIFLAEIQGLVGFFQPVFMPRYGCCHLTNTQANSHFNFSSFV